jgi:ABC-type proline/glycine betaine transport system ATPase subunit
MQKSTTFTTVFHVKKCNFHYDFACKKLPLSLRYAKKNVFTFRETTAAHNIVFVPKLLKYRKKKETL